MGKGIAFDSGGNPIKPADRMEEMKYDMSGAAGVRGTFEALGQLKPPVNVVGIVPSTENLPSGTAIKPGDIVFMDIAALTWNGYKSCYYRTYIVGKEPTQEQKDYYAIALKWLYDSIKAVKVGTTTREIASKWPSAKEAWGYEEEDQAAANLWGHGLGLAQYDPPVISRIW